MPRRSSAQRDSLQSVGGSGDVCFNFVMSKSKYGLIGERVRYPVRGKPGRRVFIVEFSMFNRDLLSFFSCSFVAPGHPWFL